MLGMRWYRCRCSLHGSIQQWYNGRGKRHYKNGHWLSDGVGGHSGFACLRGLDDTKRGQDRTGPFAKCTGMSVEKAYYEYLIFLQLGLFLLPFPTCLLVHFTSEGSWKNVKLVAAFSRLLVQDAMAYARFPLYSSVRLFPSFILHIFTGRTGKHSV